jgi:Arc-like DNA binding domain
MPKDGQVVVPVKVRMPTDVRQRLEREAKKRGSTVNAEILRRLHQSFQKESAPDLLSEIVGLLRAQNEQSAAERKVFMDYLRRPADEAASKERYRLMEEMAQILGADRGVDPATPEERELQRQSLLRREGHLRDVLRRMLPELTHSTHG